MRSCTGPWEAKWPSVGREAAGGQSGRRGGGRIGDPVILSELSVYRPRAGCRFTVGESRPVQADRQTFLSWLITSAGALTKNVLIEKS